MTDDPTPEEAEALLGALETLPSPGQYTPMDRYRDFRAVFGTEQGKRVLHQIMAWGHCMRPSFMLGPQSVDPYVTHIREGERNLALTILTTIHKEPVEAPASANRKRGDNG